MFEGVGKAFIKVVAIIVAVAAGVIVGVAGIACLVTQL